MKKSGIVLPCMSSPIFEEVGTNLLSALEVLDRSQAAQRSG